MIVDADVLFGEALADVLQREGVEVSAIVPDPAAAPVTAAQHSPDVVLMDAPHDNGDPAALVRSIVEQCPGTAVLLMTAGDEEDLVGQVVSAGCRGLVTKQATMARLLKAIAAAVAGQTVFLSPARGDAPDPRSPSGRCDLTAREREVLEHLVWGRTSRQISDDLGITANTVRTHIHKIFRKLDVHSRLEAVVHAVRHGLVHAPVGDPDARNGHPSR